MDGISLGERLEPSLELFNGKQDDSDTEDCSDENETGESTFITVHPLTNQPNLAYNKLNVWKTHQDVEPLPLDTPVYPDKVRFVCISDTHERLPHMEHPIPPGDVLLHAGDFTSVGRLRAVQNFNEALGELPHEHKIVIAGNHDLTFDEDMVFDPSREEDLGLSFRIKPNVLKEQFQELGVARASDLLTNCTYLEDSGITIYGIKIYGSPWQPEFCDWGFNLDRGQPCLDKWNLIPNDTDVLMTHGPALGHGDLCISHARAGCVELLSTIQKRVKPKFHVFGHIHEDYGITTDGVTTYINASTMTKSYRPKNPPIIFDIPLPEGVTKNTKEKKCEQETKCEAEATQNAPELVKSE